MRSWSSISVLVLVVLCTAISACSSTIHKRTRSIAGYDTLSVDAKQRIVFFGKTPWGKPVVCAEPSPDALVAISAALAGQGSGARPAPTTEDQDAKDTLDAGFGVSSSETAASIAMRTATIQVLRDGYYRLCEALMNGSITDSEYCRILHGIDPFITTVMSIDAIGGTQRAPLVAVTGGVVDVRATATGASATVDGATPVPPTTPDGTPGPAPPQTNVAIGKVTVPAPDANQAIAIRNIVDAYLAYDTMSKTSNPGYDPCARSSSPPPVVY